MPSLKRVHIKKDERGFLLRDGEFERLLPPGRHWIAYGLSKAQVHIIPLDRAEFSHSLADYLMAHEPAVVEAEFIRVELKEDQVGLRFENDVLVEVLAPTTRRLFWKAVHQGRVEVLSIRDQAEIGNTLLSRLTQTQMGQKSVAGLSSVLMVQVPDHGAGLLTIDGKVQALLQPGTYGYWKFNRQISVEPVDLRLQVMEVQGQDILTKDKVGLRINLSAAWRYTDVMTAYRQLQRPNDHLYRELQFGLRAVVGTRTLDELLDNKVLIDEGVMAHVKNRLSSYGIEVESCGVKDIVLPGDMKTILAQVVTAEKTAQAQVIRRREETAATRSLLNTAKVMEGNPVALRMKELETLERVAERIDKISVFGGLDQVLNGMIRLG
jgi:regulator of protease activity HflC (stomatin/prohibitin superfamily)